MITNSQSAAAQPIPSSQRPIPLRCRPDLVAQPMDFHGATWWILKDPIGLKYHRLQAEHYATLSLLDGQRSLKEIREALIQQFPMRVLPLADVQRMITSLHTQGLLLTQRPGQAGPLLQRQRTARRSKRRQLLGSLLSLRLPGWDPEASLTWLYRYLFWIFHPVVGMIAIALVVSSWVVLATQFQEFRSRLPAFQQFFTWQNLTWLWLTLSVTKVIHEFGHGLTCKHFGGECHEMGVMVLVFSPTLYCDVTDSWMLPDKWARIWIAAAGMIVEVVLSALAIFVWWFTTPGLLNHLCLNVFFVTTLTTVIFNANPLMRYDGYYMLSDWLEIPNLRARPGTHLRNAFAEYCLGLHTPPEPMAPVARRGWFLTYAIASTLYGWFVLFSVLVFLYLVLKPYGLQSLGITAAALSVSGILGNLLANIWRVISAPRSEPMNRTRATFSAVLALGAVAGAVLYPFPMPIEAPFLIEPHNVVHLLVANPAELVGFEVKPGQSVQQGQVLVTLRDDVKADLLSELEAARDVQLAEVAKLHALELHADHALAVKQLESIEARIADVESQLNELTVVAPIAGRVVAAPRVAEPPLAAARQLHGWSGHIENPANVGCVVDTRTHLLSIAPDSRMQALLFLDQSNREDLQVGRSIEIKFEHLADRTYRADVVDIAREHSEAAPATLSARMGGDLNSVTDARGNDRLTSVAYQARVVLEDEPGLLKPGMRGSARFFVQRRSLAGWLWRQYQRTFRFL